MIVPVRPISPLATRWSRLLDRFAADAGDSLDVRAAKRLLASVAIMVLPAGLIWGFIYWIFGEPLAAAIPWGYDLVALVVICVFIRTGRYDLLRTFELVAILVAPFLLALALGGVEGSSGVILWSFICPVSAIVFVGPRRAWWWLAAFVLLVAVSLPLGPALRPEPVNLPAGVVLALGGLNIVAVALVCFALLATFARQREAARRRVEELVLNILPQPIAERLQVDRSTIADQFEAASVLFADVVNFTPMSDQLSAGGLVSLLDALFTDFDHLADALGLEKIKTIGDCYMVAAGVPAPRVDHAEALARMALAMRERARQHLRADGTAIQLRIGISSGPVVAGVIGRRRFLYDLWGDAVNTASRMESHGEPDHIQITRATYDLIVERFDCRLRGMVDVKGKGPMETWYLVGELA